MTEFQKEAKQRGELKTECQARYLTLEEMGSTFWELDFEREIMRGYKLPLKKETNASQHGTVGMGRVPAQGHRSEIRLALAHPRASRSV